MALISLTEYGTGLAFYLDDSQIEMVYDTVVDGTTVASILRSDPHNTGYNTNPLYTTQLTAAIVAASKKLISLPVSAGADTFVTTGLNASVNHFGAVQAPTASFPTGATSQFEYFKNGSTMTIYYSTTTPANIAAAIVAKGNQLA